MARRRRRRRVVARRHKIASTHRKTKRAAAKKRRQIAKIAKTMSRERITMKDLRHHAEEHRMMKEMGISGRPKKRGAVKTPTKPRRARTGVWDPANQPGRSSRKACRIFVDRRDQSFPATKAGYKQAVALAVRAGNGAQVRMGCGGPLLQRMGQVIDGEYSFELGVRAAKKKLRY